MRKLILVRHSETKIVPGIAANQWQLTEEGRARCQLLAERLLLYTPTVIVTSHEPKAIETGELVAEILKRPVVTAENLHEHDRSNETTFYGFETFRSIIASLFEKPHALVYGKETADEAHERFAGAVRDVVERYPDGNLVIVTHATALTLFVSRLAGIDPFPFWEQLGMPAFVVFSLPEFGLCEVVPNVMP
jgi:broad specificity phosphatase PhoE